MSAIFTLSCFKAKVRKVIRILDCSNNSRGSSCITLESVVSARGYETVSPNPAAGVITTPSQLVEILIHMRRCRKVSSRDCVLTLLPSLQRTHPMSPYIYGKTSSDNRLILGVIIDDSCT